MSDISIMILNLVEEATSEYNDGFTKAAAKRTLKDKKKYINNTLVSKKVIQNRNTT